MNNTIIPSAAPLQVTDRSNDIIMTLTILFGVLTVTIEGLNLLLTYLGRRQAPKANGQYSLTEL